jgi:hypothetical protein
MSVSVCGNEQGFSATARYSYRQSEWEVFVVVVVSRRPEHSGNYLQQ